MRELLFLQPIFKEKIWGGSRLKTVYGMDIPSEHTGECWIASSCPQGMTKVRGGTFDGWLLQTLWEKHRELFGQSKDREFPLLVKIIDAQEDLSIQVHPDDGYANIKGNGVRGKVECWYVLECGDEGELILGHRAKTRRELEQMVLHGAWEQLLEKVPARKGDFFYVPGGTVHALKKGMLVLEIQQPSDTTYRLYDYGRKENGKPRQLHLRESLEAAAVPHCAGNQTIRIERCSGLTRTTLTETPYFTICKYDVQGKISLPQDKPFLIMGILEGQGFIDSMRIQKGDYWLLPCGYGRYNLEGAMTLITATKEE